jgi:uncharacterized protein YceK
MHRERNSYARMKIAAVLSAVAMLLGGCATNASLEAGAQRLFKGRYANVEQHITTRSCSALTYAKCDKRQYVVSYRARDDRAKVSLMIGPMDKWSDADMKAGFLTEVRRSGDEATVVMKRFGEVPDDCVGNVEMDAGEGEELVLPACHSYPEVVASWREVGAVEKSVKKSTAYFWSFVTAITGGELP